MDKLEKAKEALSKASIPFCQFDYSVDTEEEANKLLRTFSPNKGKNMNVTPIMDPTDNVGQNFYIDAEGNRVEIPFDVTPDSDGEAAQPVTAFIAEDGEDHPVTVH